MKKELKANFAATWLANGISKGRWHSAGRLPTLRALAQESGVSRLTMWEAVQALSKAGILVTGRGKRIALAALQPEVVPSAESWDDIAQKVSAAIYNGEYGPGSLLPPLSKLQIHYHVCFRTLQKAFSALVSRGILNRTGARYTVAGTSETFPQFEIILFVEKSVENEHTQTLRIASEQIASKSNMVLFRNEYTHTEPLLTSGRKRLLSRKTVGGYIVDYWGITTEERFRYFLDLMSLLYNSKKPISIIDHIGSAELPEPFKSSRRVHIFSIAGALAGIDVGRYLLSQGHKTAVFITSSFTEYWVHQRFEGIRRAFGEASIPPESLKLYKGDLSQSANTVICGAVSLSNREIEQLYSHSMSRDALEKLKIEAQSMAGLMHLPAEEIEDSRTIVQSLLSLYGTSLDKQLTDSIRVRIFENLAHKLHTQFLQPMFDSVIREQTATAWVCVADAIGRAAVSYLQHRPDSGTSGKISVVSFDNSRFAVEENLTSYDFDIAGIFQQSVSFVTGRYQPNPAKRRTECRGVLCVRASSGKRIQQP